ncbi:hypothetical protein EXN66_Car000774 [Channa argus]|uniref:Uncharacterized protein n=1 Tax=Channa argus TaxID=215402 RepID=A0A6G1QY28_CHAAH|nr:hypothetical protein EXN66_Car000774 [Channa argus]
MALRRRASCFFEAGDRHVGRQRLRRQTVQADHTGTLQGNWPTPRSKRAPLTNSSPSMLDELEGTKASGGADLDRRT